VEELFDGYAIIGDQHFEFASAFFEKCEVIAPVSRQKGELKECASLRHPTRMKRVLPAAVETHNAAIRAFRGRVETPFASCKRLFANLSNKFRGNTDEHKWVVLTAFAFHNLRLVHRHSHP